MSTSRLIPTLLLMIVTASGSCERSNTGAPVAEPAFRPDGSLTFRKLDGTVLTRIVIEIADTQQAQATGLMGRRSLPDRGGMLFVNEVPRMQSFWMRSTPLPLDIIFIRADSTITNIVKRTTPLSDERIESTEEVQHVLEVRAGFTDRYGIDETVTISWERLDPSTS